jgi:hypothetical protein
MVNSPSTISQIAREVKWVKVAVIETCASRHALDVP